MAASRSLRAPRGTVAYSGALCPRLRGAHPEVERKVTEMLPGVLGETMAPAEKQLGPPKADGKSERAAGPSCVGCPCFYAEKGGEIDAGLTRDEAG